MTASNDRRIATVLSSAHFVNAEVLVTECGHRHLRPRGMYRSGDMLSCPFCEERETFPLDPRAPVIDDGRRDDW